MTNHLSRANYEAIRDHIFDRIHRTGEEIKNDLPNILRTAIKTETWKHFSDAESKPFKSLVDWLHYTFPHGPMMGNGQYAISYQDAIQLCAGAPDVLRVLLENAPKDKGGRPVKNAENNRSVHTPVLQRRGNKSKSAVVLSVRLAKERPKFYEAYMRGKYKSVTAAATAAGLIKNDANLRGAKSKYRKLTPPERKEFHAWLKKFRAQERKNQ